MGWSLHRDDSHIFIRSGRQTTDLEFLLPCRDAAKLGLQAKLLIGTRLRCAKDGNADARKTSCILISWSDGQIEQDMVDSRGIANAAGTVPVSAPTKVAPAGIAYFSEWVPSVAPIVS